MTDDDKKMFSAIMLPLSKLYDLGLEDKHIIKFWFDMLSDLTIEQVAVAVKRYVKSPDVGTYKPKPADIIKMISGTSIDKAFSAWSLVEKSIRRVGTYQTVVFDDPLIHRVISDMGGWISLCQCTENELPFKAKEFQQRYNGFSTKQEIPEHPRKLYGLLDQQNAAAGYNEEQEPVLIGNTEKARLLLDGGYQVENWLLLEN